MGLLDCFFVLCIYGVLTWINSRRQDPMLSTILDTSIGVITGFITLIISHAMLAPRLDISPDIRALWSEKYNRYSYSIRLKKYRGPIDLIDVRIQCRLYVQDVRMTGRSSWDIYRINTSAPDMIIFSRKGFRTYIRLNELWDEAPTKNPYLFDNTKVHIPSYGIRLEDFFLSYKNVYLIVHVIGADRFTGVTKVFASPRYQMRDVRYGEWHGMLVKGRRQ